MREAGKGLKGLTFLRGRGENRARKGKKKNQPWKREKEAAQTDADSARKKSTGKGKITRRRRGK